MKFYGNCRFVSFIIVFMFLFSTVYSEDTLEIVSPSYFNEQDIIYDDIHYLEKEHLSFNFCTDENSTNIIFEVTCDTSDNTLLKISKDTDNPGCYFSNFNMDEATCEDFDLEIGLSTNNKEKKIKRSFIRQKQSKLINFVLGLDFNLLNPKDLSYFLVVENDVEGLESKNSVDAYEKLKNDRDNTNKCWSSGACTITDTAQILRNLVLATFTLDTRLLDDGKSYIEKRLISNENNPIRFIIKADGELEDGDEITCTLQIDDEKELDYDLDDNETIIDKYASESVLFSCNETVADLSFTIYNIDEVVDDIISYDDESSISYTVESFSCIGENNKCSYTNTIDSLNTYRTTIDTHSLLQTYINSLIVEDSSGNKIISGSSNYNEDFGKFLLQKENEGIEDYLKFRQNNDGSWGKDSRYDRVKETAWAIIGLQNVNSESEYIADGKKWIYFNEPETGWGSVEKNALAYLAIKEQIKPYVKINTVNEIEDFNKFTIENPTVYNIKNLKVELSEEIISSVSYSENLGDLDGEKSSTFNITVNDNFYGIKSGTMKITGIDGKNKEIELLEIPINIKGPLPLTLIGGFYYVTSEVPFVSLKIEKNIPKYSIACDYINPFTKKKIELNLNQGNSFIEIENNILKEGNFTFEMNCIYDEIGFTLNSDLNVVKAIESFYLDVENFTITKLENFSILLTSTSSDIQRISVKLDGDYVGLIESGEQNKIIASDDVREIFLEIKNPVFLEALGNTTKGNIIVTSDSGFSKVIPLHVNLGVSDDSSGLSKWLWAILIILFLFVCLILYRLYELKKYENMPENNEENNDEFYLD